MNEQGLFVDRIRNATVTERTLTEVVTDNVFSRSQIEEKSEFIHDRLLRGSSYLAAPNFRAIHTDDLSRLFEFYDELFFEGRCGVAARQGENHLSFRLSKRMTSAGGTTSRKRQRVSKRKYRTDYQITVSTTLLFDTFNAVQRPIVVAGLSCNNRLQALQRIFEHEMIHLAEMLVWSESSCRGPRFQNIASRIFDHTDVVHQLITPQEKAHVAFGLRAGDVVTFHMDGVQYRGKINRITKRATVLVQDQSGPLYNDGNRYAKFYVPLSMLQRAG